MPRISDEKINEIRSKADIVSIVSQYIPLTKKGKNYVGLCPFHDDHNPSLSISSEKQIYKCFVCHAGGNVFSFVSDFEKISFVDAVVKVAKEVSVDVGDFTYQQAPLDPIKEKQINVLEMANQFLKYQLQSSEGLMIKEYLKNRGISEEVIETFDVGYNPSNNAVSTFLLAKKCEPQTMVDVNIATENNNRLNDVFYDRITFPIKNEKGQLIGFTARSMFEDQSKYINTATTNLYTKSEVVYNIHLAKEHAKKQGFIVVVEGVMDVIAYYRAGIKNVVSPLGTALTKQQVDTIKKASYHVVLSFDGDDAGKSATYQAIELLISKNVLVEVIMLDQKEDPDDIINKQGKQALLDVVKTRKHWMEFMLEYGQQLYNLDNYNQKKTYIKSMIEHIRKLQDTMDQNHFGQVLAKITDMDQQEILQAIASKATLKRDKIKETPTAQDFLVPIYEKEILAQMILSKQAIVIFTEQLGYLSHPQANELAKMLISMSKTSENMIEIADILSKAQERDLKQFLMWLLDWPLFPKGMNKDVLNDAIVHVKLKIIDDKIKKLKKMAALTTSSSKKAEYINKMIEAQKEVDQLKKKERVYETI